jgi:hypothetical protein
MRTISARSTRFIELALADAGEGEVSQDDGLWLRLVVKGFSRALKDLLCPLGVVQEQIARADEPTMLCG